MDTSGGLEGVCIYTDDNLVFALTKDAHDDILPKVLHHLHAKDSRIRLHKCWFFKCLMPFFVG